MADHMKHCGTYGTKKKLHVSLLLLTIFGPIYSGHPWYSCPPTHHIYTERLDCHNYEYNAHLLCLITPVLAATRDTCEGVGHVRKHIPKPTWIVRLKDRPGVGMVFVKVKGGLSSLNTSKRLRAQL